VVIWVYVTIKMNIYMLNKLKVVHVSDIFDAADSQSELVKGALRPSNAKKVNQKTRL